jgi:NTE family protein
MGAYRALREAGYTPDVVAGVSIGAFTAAVIAGNDPDRRMARLGEFWDAISWLDVLEVPNAGVDFTKYHNMISSTQSCMFGQPNFFTPRTPALPQLHPRGTPGATSYYDTRMLEITLDKLVDFDRINAKKTRLLLGAVRVKSGDLVFFDNFKTTINARHVMASGAMPPGFPGIKIDGDLYWDGGCVSNTPLEAIDELEPKVDTLAVAIDLFNPEGKEPDDMEEVLLRMKDIQFASKTSGHIEHLSRRHNLACALHNALGGNSAAPKNAMPNNMPNDKKDDKKDELRRMCRSHRFDILHVVYESPAFETVTKDCEFSGSSIKRRSEAGYNDLKKALGKHPDTWSGKSPEHAGGIVQKFSCGKFV